MTITENETGAVFIVKLKTRAGRTRLIGVEGDVLKAEVSSAPVAGEANIDLLRLLAREFDLPVTRFRIIKGRKSRIKTISVDNCGSEQIRRKLIDRSLVQVEEKR